MRGPASLRLSTRAADTHTPRLAVHWVLATLAFSLPLEYPNRFPYEITTMVGALVVFAALTHPVICFGRLPGAAVCFAGYLYMMLMSLVLQGATYPGGFYLGEFARLFQFLLLWTLVFWLATNTLRDERMWRSILWALVLGCSIRAAVAVLGFARPVDPGSGSGRMTILGQNANQSAQVLALGLIALIGLVYIQPRGVLRPRAVAWGGVGLIATGIVQTGSRGGLVTLAVGLLVYAMTGRTLGARIRNVAVVLVGATVLVLTVTNSEVMRTRLMKAEAGDLAHREKIFPELVQMFREKPLLGWGPITNKYEVAARLGDPHNSRRDAHNVPLEVLTATGLLGALPFFLGVWLCLRSAWSARAGPCGAVPLAMLLAVLAGNMSENRIAGPLLWLVLACALASGGIGAAALAASASEVAPVQRPARAWVPPRRVRA